MPVKRWLLTQYGHSWVEPDLFVFCATDIPAHLYLRWTDKEEHVHLRTEIDRGLAKPADPAYCFVEWKEVEQNEPGDTLEHTFSFTGWHECITRWWHFRATIEGQDSPSNTAIFKAHAFDYKKAFTMKHTDLTDKEVAGVIDHADESVTPAKLSSPFTFDEFPFTPGAAPSADYEVANKKYVDDQLAAAFRVFDYSNWLGLADIYRTGAAGVPVKWSPHYARFSIGDVAGEWYMGMWHHRPNTLVGTEWRLKALLPPADTNLLVLTTFDWGISPVSSGLILIASDPLNIRAGVHLAGLTLWKNLGNITGAWHEITWKVLSGISTEIFLDGVSQGTIAQAPSPILLANFFPLVIQAQADEDETFNLDIGEWYLHTPTSPP